MAATMINVAEAKELILKNAIALTPVKLSLPRAAGMVLAENVYASINIPAYAQSSMDGYAFNFSDWKNGGSLIIKGEMAAGTNENFSLATGTAARIFTGAPVPAGADTVVMQEKTKVENGQLIILDNDLKQGINVRLKGSEINEGDLAVAKDSLLMPAAIGFLAGIGVTEVSVYPDPSISIIVTGNELIQPGQPLQKGQVYESNSYSLQAALKQLHIQNVKVFRVEDDLEKVKQVLKDALEQSDIVFLTGGVSVGEYDFVAAAAEENGIEKVFHKIKQRPGKPLFYGRKENKMIFGLPGNPASVLTCFYEYVEPALQKIMKKQSGLRVTKAPLSTAFKKATGLTHFLKGLYDGNTVTPLHAQESYRLSSFANANCLIKIEEDVTNCDKGELVEIHLLPA
jgi:molybdopterin molybdotransferase